MRALSSRLSSVVLVAPLHETVQRFNRSAAPIEVHHTGVEVPEKTIK
jgi:hypothetical protein